jgi:predicted metal-dependent hydrolase
VDKRAVCAALCRWLSRLAKRELVARLQRLSAASGLGYTRCSIRGQRGRWGSASTSGHVCLNYKLLFLSSAVVDYVILHELTHTLHPDHSPRFWRRLEAVSPDCRRRHQELQYAAAAVPWWAEQ